MLEKFQNINPSDMDFFHVTDDVAEAVQIAARCYAQETSLGPKPPPMSAAASETTAEGTRVGVDPTRRTPGDHNGGSNGGSNGS